MSVAYRMFLKHIFVIALFVILIASTQGCASLCPVGPVKSETSKVVTDGTGDKKVGKVPDTKAARLGIKPTKETEKFFSAVKDSTKVIIIDGSEAGLDDREQTPLSCFNSDEKIFWDLLAALVSATAEGEP